MSNINNNTRFQLLVNDEVVATAGIKTYGVLVGTLSWVKRDPAERPAWTDDPDFDAEEWIDEELTIDLGGLENNESITWFEQSLKPGDEVTIKILEAGTIDEPIESRTNTPISEAKGNIHNLWRVLKTNMASDPNAIILKNDGRFIVFYNAVVTLTNEHYCLENAYKLNVESLTTQDLFEQVCRLRDLISE